MKETQTNKLKPGFSSVGMWAFSIGTSIGCGSFIVTCNTYLQKSGLLGTVFGLLVGMAVILMVTWNLQYMIRTAPNAGGIYSFEKHVNSRDVGFIAFWFVLLTYLAILWANISSVPLFARFFLGKLFQFGFHYEIFGYEVWLGEALLSVFAVVIAGLLCANSRRIPNILITVAALTFAIGFTVCAVIAVFEHDNTFSYAPIYTEGSSAFRQIVRIAAISPWAFIGFENISHFSEEYTFPIKKVRGILIWSVVITTALYLFVSVLSVSAYPPEYSSWLDYIRDMGNLSGIKAVPAFYSANHYLGQTGVTILMFALFGVILTSLIANMLALSRLLFAAGRDGDAPGALGSLNKRSIPYKAIYTVVAISVLIPFLGRTAIGWIIDVTTLGATLIYCLISHSVYRHAKQSDRKIEKFTGIAGIVLMIIFLILLLVPGLLPFHAMETESYVLFIIWSVLGLVYFRWLLHKNANHEYKQRIFVWILLLVMLLFASMMCVSRLTEDAANKAVQQIYEYHESHPADDSIKSVREDRIAFLNEQAKEISSTNTIYTVVSLGLFVLVISMMLNYYRETQKLGERLTAAKKEAESAKRIAELKESISSLLDNIPGLTFTKDAKTGVYLACNQAFAVYAHKDDPSGVIGLTDAQIFDEETAAHFVEDDKMALSMETPYIFYEDVPDAAGSHRRLQTTKLKYIDTAGRLCVLGICRDVTDMVRIQRESATNKEAYEKALSAGIMYTHIAQSLARDYTDLYYINIETNEFIEYNTSGESNILTESKRGDDFFESCKTDAIRFVHSDDRDTVLKALDRETLLNTLNRNRTFVMTYRIISDEGPIYVTLKASRMKDDDQFIVIGVTDVNEEVKQRREAERMREEYIAFTRLNALNGDFICVYVVDPKTGEYREFSATKSFGEFALEKEGKDFFDVTRENCRFIYKDDIDRFLSIFTEENVLSEVIKNGMFLMSYRLVIGGKPTYVQLKVVMLEEKEGRRLIVGVNNIDNQVRLEEEYEKRLAQAQIKANMDALIGIKNRYAYLDMEEQLDRQIAEHHNARFAIVIADVNNLKEINDTLGHKAGDECLRCACKILCNIFSHSPIFRIGGDEFTIVVQNSDYEIIDELIDRVDAYNRKALADGGVVIACGMSRFEDDSCVAPVFERADQNMYKNKNDLKS